MFSFFNKRNTDIKSVEIPSFRWDKSKNTKSIIEWINPEQTIAISINFFDLPPDIPTISDLDTLRAFYRNSVASVNGGLIEVDIFQIKGISVAKTIFKIPQSQSGITYLASLTIPFENCSFVVKTQCAEVGYTGMREAIIVNNVISMLGEEEMENWSADPYDRDFKAGTLMNKSEQRIHDNQFPKHPLTQARAIIEKISREITFKSEILKLNTFKK